MFDQAYKDAVEADFKTRGFTESCFAGTGHWDEVLDPTWNWKRFDYRIPDYTESKSFNELQNNVTDFVTNFHV